MIDKHDIKTLLSPSLLSDKVRKIIASSVITTFLQKRRVEKEDKRMLNSIRKKFPKTRFIFDIKQENITEVTRNFEKLISMFWNKCSEEFVKDGEKLGKAIIFGENHRDKYGTAIKYPHDITGTVEGQDLENDTKEIGEKLMKIIQYFVRNEGEFFNMIIKTDLNLYFPNIILNLKKPDNHTETYIIFYAQNKWFISPLVESKVVDALR